MPGVCKRFGAVEALVDVDSEVHSGEVVALVGDNGAGKPRCVGAIVGPMRPDAGRALRMAVAAACRAIAGPVLPLLLRTTSATARSADATGSR